MKLFNRDRTTGIEYIVRSTIEPVSFRTRAEARLFKKLLKNSNRKVNAEIVKYVKDEGYVVSQERVS